MNKSYHQEQDLDSTGLEILAQLSLYADSENKTISFACDWINNEEGIDYIANIIYSLKYGNLLDKVLSGLHRQCVLNDNVEDYNKIINKVNEIAQENKKPNEVIIKPTDISKLQ